MKYLVASDGSNAGDSVSSQFSRASCFAIVDSENDSFDILHNGNDVDLNSIFADSARAGVKRLICGNIGPNALSLAQKNSIAVVLSPHITVRKAVEMASKDQLRVVHTPSSHHIAH